MIHGADRTEKLCGAVALTEMMSYEPLEGGVPRSGRGGRRFKSLPCTVRSFAHLQRHRHKASPPLSGERPGSLKHHPTAEDATGKINCRGIARPQGDDCANDANRKHRDIHLIIPSAKKPSAKDVHQNQH